MPRWKAPVRDQRLQQLRAFGLFIRGEHTLYHIAEALGIAESNPSTAAGRARTRIDQGWRIIREHKVRRWERWLNVEFPAGAWQTLHGARLWTHPPAEPAPPSPEPTPFERLLLGMRKLQEEASAGGFVSAAQGLENMAAALRYQRRQAEAERKEAAAATSKIGR